MTSLGRFVPERAKARLRPLVLVARKVRRREVTLTGLAWSRTSSYSQFGEDLAVLHHFGEDHAGFFVDVGAFHPHLISNTAALRHVGWHGINIEPDPDRFAVIARARPEDTNICCAVSRTPGRVEFVSNGSFSGIDDSSYQWSRGDSPVISVETRTLSSILDENAPIDRPIDLLTIDCEGHDFEVVESNDWDRYRPAVVLVERHAGGDHARDPVRSLLDRGYRLDRTMGLTCMLVDAQRPRVNREPDRSSTGAGA